MEEEKKWLIVGLGNPGETYKGTRHNVGFQVVDAFAQKNGFSFKHAAHLFGDFAQGMLEHKPERKKVLVLKPMTYMNESGVAVRRCADYFKVPIDDLIIVSDDGALPLGALRMRTKGSCGGHNGLHSIEMHLGTQDYSRLRFGVGMPPQGRMKDFVLGAFGQEEMRVVEEAVVQAVYALELWVLAGIAAAMQKANTQTSEGKEGDKNDQAKETSL